MARRQVSIAAPTGGFQRLVREPFEGSGGGVGEPLAVVGIDGSDRFVVNRIDCAGGEPIGLDTAIETGSHRRVGRRTAKLALERGADGAGLAPRRIAERPIVAVLRKASIMPPRSRSVA